MLIGIAHARGEERVYEGQRQTKVHRCGTASCQESVHQLGQCGSHTLEPFGFGFKERHAATRQRVCVCVHFWLGSAWLSRGMFICLPHQAEVEPFKLTSSLWNCTGWPFSPLANRRGHVGSTVWVQVIFSHCVLLGRGWNNPPVTSQPISPSDAQRYVSWWSLWKGKRGQVEKSIPKAN